MKAMASEMKSEGEIEVYVFIKGQRRYTMGD